MSMLRRWMSMVVMLGLFMSGCGDSFKSSIPSVSISFSCSLLQSPYYRLTTPGQFLKVTHDAHNLPVGYAGLIIGQSIFSDGNTYVAFDAACPVEAQRNVSIELLEDKIGQAECPQCHTVYNLNSNGAPIEGEGREYLKHYNVSVTGTTLRVYN